jgi:hypothetical protein
VSELDDLERELREAGGVWFRDDLLLKLERLIEIARAGEAALAREALKHPPKNACSEALERTRFEREGIRI